MQVSKEAVKEFHRLFPKKIIQHTPQLYKEWIKLIALLLFLTLITSSPALAQAPTITFEDSGQRLGNSPTTVVALGDLDGDGDLDAVVGNDYPELAQVWLNNGVGIFTDTGQRFGQTAVRDIGLGDLDRDGDLDVVLGSTYDFADTIYVNNGQGNFSLQQTLDADETAALELGDVNNDGHLDAVILSYDQHKVWLNNGAGRLIASPQAIGARGVDVKLGDLDRDGDLDFVVSGGTNRSYVWLNAGGNQPGTPGNFSRGQEYRGSVSNSALGLADFNNDNYLDIFDGIVYLNNGSATFSASTSGPSVLFSLPTDVDIGDIDGDGDPDLLISTALSLFILQNDGMGQGGRTYSFEFRHASTGNRAGLGDLNGDGSLDVFMPHGVNYPPVNGPNQVWFNRTPPPPPPPAPAIRVNHTPARPGSRLLIEGENLPYPAEFEVLINGQLFQQGLTSDAQQQVAFGLDTPDADPGFYVVTLRQAGTGASTVKQANIGDTWKTAFSLVSTGEVYGLPPGLSVDIYDVPSGVAVEATHIYLPTVLR